MKIYKTAIYYTAKMARETSDPEILRKILGLISSSHRHDQFGNNAVNNAAANPYCPLDVLEKLVQEHPSGFLCVCVAGNSNSSPDLLRTIIEKTANDTAGHYALRNKNCPKDIFKKIIDEDKNINLCYAVAGSMHCPPEVLAEIIRKGSIDSVSSAAISNPVCPPEVLVEVLNESKSGFMCGLASRNPNCPPEAKIKWMRENGRIITEDPKKHIIDEVKDEEDKGLEELRKMVSKDNNWYKTAAIDRNKYAHQMYPYNEGNLRYTMDLDLLKEVIREGHDFWPARWAMQNLNCPPELIVDVLRREQYDLISTYAINHRNCPTSIIEEILARGKDDTVSHYAANRSHCPIEAKIKWMKATGKIMKEDPKKHIIDEVKDEEDKDLEELKKMVSKNDKVYKTSENDDYYSVYVAQDTKDPEILTKILRHFNDDDVSRSAIENPHCPPELLAEVLRRLKNDFVSKFAAFNPNCTPEILENVLKKSPEAVMECAVLNPSCTPELLTNVLEGMYTDNKLVMLAATKNENCPRIPKLKWLMQYIDSYPDPAESDWSINNTFFKYRNLTAEDIAILKHEWEISKDVHDLNADSFVLGKNNNWYKTSNRATMEGQARHSKDIEVLKKILNGDDLWVAYEALKNPNCPRNLILEWIAKHKLPLDWEPLNLTEEEKKTIDSYENPDNLDMNSFKEIMASNNWYKVAVKQQSIQQIAKAVRDIMVGLFPSNKILKDECKDTSKRLKAELVKNGYNASVIMGTFRVDNPNVEEEEMDTKGLTEEEIADMKYTPMHFWVEIGYKIIDLTPSQFNEQLNKKVPDIIIGDYSNLPRYTRIQVWDIE